MVYTAVTRDDDERRRRRGCRFRVQEDSVKITRDGSREASWYSGSLCNPEAKASAVVRHKYLGTAKSLRNIPSHANPTLPRSRGSRASRLHLHLQYVKGSDQRQNSYLDFFSSSSPLRTRLPRPGSQLLTFLPRHLRPTRFRQVFSCHHPRRQSQSTPA